MRTRITYILSNINKALAFEWITDYLDKNKFELSFILLNSGESFLERYLQTKNVRIWRIPYRGKKNLPKAITKIYQILKQENTQLVHCHLFDACIAGLTAAKLAGIKKRIYTRHHATFHQVYFPRAVWYDKFISAMATDIVAISENVRQTLINEGVKAEKIHTIHHGFKLIDFQNTSSNQIQILKQKYNTQGKYPIIGVISRYFELKGIQYVIPAFQKLLNSYPESLLILANATGNYASDIKHLLKQLPQINYVEITFEPEIFALYQLFDIFIHVPIDPTLEAFGQTYVEALAAGIPSVFTLSGVSGEFVQHEKNALVVPFKDSEAIYESILKILENRDLKNRLIAEGKKDVNKFFELQQMIMKLEQMYE
ncbi:glycosyltransferase family 4 protein [Rhodocytophaga aerolata]|uniref:Glycosyltransferase family 4 protein n=1 Tax=Rhodocytophaga aerolata TaxID=455078 RepID=A0ABT8R9S6_9BACT|nr:glycosyltransferase family 4 protein [Rhodocytophaga aerolata]MDO1448850.1 glycosyltransferase family 4 protein [Rhodocytophaga aerolata]